MFPSIVSSTVCVCVCVCVLRFSFSYACKFNDQHFGVIVSYKTEICIIHVINNNLLNTVTKLAIYMYIIIYYVRSV